VRDYTGSSSGRLENRQWTPFLDHAIAKETAKTSHPWIGHNKFGHI